MNQVDKAYGKKPKLEDYNHVWLYAKGHYFKDDRLEDLKVIVGERCALDPQYVNNEEIFRILLTITHRHLREDLYVRMLLEVFGIRKLFPNEPHEIKDGIGHLLGAICQIQIFDDNEMLINIGEADVKILPLNPKIDVTI